MPVFSAVIRKGLCFATLALALAGLPAAAEETRTRAEYTVTMGGTHIANVDIILTDNGSVYSLNLDARIAGLAQLIASGSAKATSTGVSARDGLHAQKFDLLTRAAGDEFTSAITFASG